MSARIMWMVGAATVFAFAAACVALATTRGPNGMIAYAEETTPEHFQIFTIGADGSGRTQITHAASAQNPDWSWTESRSFSNWKVRTARNRDDVRRRQRRPQPDAERLPGSAVISRPTGSDRVRAGLGPTDNGLWIMRDDGTDSFG